MTTTANDELEMGVEGSGYGLFEVLSAFAWATEETRRPSLVGLRVHIQNWNHTSMKQESKLRCSV
jgi:hypothetical protein